MDMQFFGETGGLKLHSKLKSTGEEIEVLAQGKKNSDWVRIQIKVESGPPYGIAGLGVEPGSPPAKQ